MPNATVSEPTPDFLSHFDAMNGPRQTAKIVYPLSEIFFLVVCAVISAAQDWVSIALYGQKSLTFCAVLLPFEDARPSHDQLGILFSRLDMDQFQRCFVKQVAEGSSKKDGNLLRGRKAVRFGFIERHQGPLPQNHLCKMLNVTSRGYRAWRDRPVCQRQRPSRRYKYRLSVNGRHGFIGPYQGTTPPKS